MYLIITTNLILGLPSLKLLRQKFVFLLSHTSDVYAANLTLVYLITENNRDPFIYGLHKDPVSTSHYVSSRARK
jgi:hypothetical protein